MIATERRSVLVVGGGGGLGRAVACGFARTGHRIGVLGRGRDGVEETLGRLDGQGHAGAVADVTDHRGLTSAIDDLDRRLDGIDVAVNTAGIFVPPAPVPDADLRAVSDLFEVNIFGTYNAMQAELRRMTPRRRGVIINFSSNIGARQQRAGLAAYGASKAAVSAMTAAAAVESAPDGIRVVALAPGPSDTTMSLRPGETAGDRDARLAGSHPLGRVASLTEIVDAVAFLASPQAAYVLGTDLVIDGGASAATR